MLLGLLIPLHLLPLTRVVVLIPPIGTMLVNLAVVARVQIRTRRAARLGGCGLPEFARDYGVPLPVTVRIYISANPGAIRAAWITSEDVLITYSIDVPSIGRNCGSPS